MNNASMTMTVGSRYMSKEIERQDMLIDKFDDILTTFKEEHVEHMGYKYVTHGIAATSSF